MCIHINLSTQSFDWSLYISTSILYQSVHIPVHTVWSILTLQLKQLFLVFEQTLKGSRNPSKGHQHSAASRTHLAVYTGPQKCSLLPHWSEETAPHFETIPWSCVTNYSRQYIELTRLPSHQFLCIHNVQNPLILFCSQTHPWPTCCTQWGNKGLLLSIPVQSSTASSWTRHIDGRRMQAVEESWNKCDSNVALWYLPPYVHLQMSPSHLFAHIVLLLPSCPSHTIVNSLPLTAGLVMVTDLSAPPHYVTLPTQHHLLTLTPTLVLTPTAAVVLRKGSLNQQAMFLRFLCNAHCMHHNLKYNTLDFEAPAACFVCLDISEAEKPTNWFVSKTDSCMDQLVLCIEYKWQDSTSQLRTLSAIM